MQQTVEADKTLLVDGPASVRLVCGKADVFGYFMCEKKVVVRQCTRLPFYAVEKSEFEVHLGVNGALQEVKGNTVPPSWNKPLEALSAVGKRPVTVLVVGQSDTGKSSLCVYIVNKLLKGGYKVAVLDGDLGQSDIGPSATVGYGIATQPITKLYKIRLTNAFFVGHTSPAKAISKVLEGLTTMKTELQTTKPDYVIVNTDGLVTGELGVQYKTTLIGCIQPDVVVGIQINKELELLATNLKCPFVIVEPSAALSERSVEKRKSLRESTYIRYLRHSKQQSYFTSQLKVEPKKGIPANLLPDKGVIVGLYAQGNRFLGIGVLRVFNRDRKILKVQTNIQSKPTRLVIGTVTLNKKCQELED